MKKPARAKRPSPPAQPGHGARGAHPQPQPGLAATAPWLVSWIGPRAALWPGLLIVLASTAVVHAPALRMFFAQDDVTFLSRARGLEPTTWSMARPLSEAWAWRLLNAAFGLHPLPYHLFGFALHLTNTALVMLIGLHLLQNRAAALSAALLFGVSSIAFTPLHWTSCVVELTVTTFSLAAFLTWLDARARGMPRLLWLGAAFGLAALLCKESSIFLPVLLLVAHYRLGPPAARLRTLIPQAAATAAYAIAFVATIHRVYYVGIETYAMSASPLFIALNLSTYLRWLVVPHIPVRDAVAAMDPSAWKVGVAVGAGIAVALWTQRRDRRHPEEVGVAWFLAFLAPVVALEHHTYLYYLYLPWPGTCWMIAGLGHRLVRRAAPLGLWITRAAAALLVLSLAAIVCTEFSSVRERERAMRGPFPLDKTVREGHLLRNAIDHLRKADLQPGDRIAFVNPGPRRHYATVDTTAVDPAAIRSYVPLEGALRNGESIRLFFPGVEYLGFSDHLPREWENAEVFFFKDDGRLRPIGRGGQALAELGYLLLPDHDWQRAEGMFMRSRELGDTLADATFGLIITRDFLGHREESNRYAEEFLRRWPNDPRAPVVARTTGPESTRNLPPEPPSLPPHPKAP